MKLRVLSFLLFLPVLAFPQEYSYKYYFDRAEGKPAAFSIFEDNRGFMFFCMVKGVHTFDGIRIHDFEENSEFIGKSVFSGIQDSKGNYWFGSNRGLCEYHGNKFLSLEKIGHVTSIHEDKNGSIWATSEKGLFRFYNGKWTSTTSLSDGSEVNYLWGITEDSKGNVYFIGRNGILKFNGSSYSWLYEDEMWKAIYCGKDDNIYFATRENLMCWDGKSFHTLVRLEDYDIRRVNCINSDSRGNLWLCTNAGLFRYGNNKLNSVPAAGDSYYKEVFNIFESSGGVLWAGMITGVCKMTPKNYEIYDANNGLEISLINEINGDKYNNLWLVSYKGGIYRFSENSFSTDFPHGKLNPSDMTSVCPASDGSLWFGTNSSNCIFRLKNGKFTSLPADPKFHRIERITEGPDKKIWFQEGAFIFFFDGEKLVNYSKTFLKGKFATILSGSGGRIWISSASGIRSDDNKIFIPFMNADSKEKLAFTGIAPDSKGNYWLATHKKGIFRYSPDKKTFENISSGQGLVGDEVYSLTFDKQNNLWIGTKSGLSELNVTEYEQSGKIVFKNYGPSEGFLRCNEDAIYCDKEGSIWVGMLDKLAKINAQATAEPFLSHQPRVYVTDVKFLYDTTNIFSFSKSRNELTGLPEDLRLPYNKNYLIFSFTGIDYRSPESVQYQYRLNGQDYHWSPLNNSNEVIYRNLQPGDYTFTVIARNKDGLWSQKAASFSFKVLPPFYKTWWFYLSISVVFILLIFTYIRIRTRNLEKLVAQRTMELSEEKQKVENINSELEKSRYQLTKINELQAKWLNDLAESERYLKEVNSSKDKFFSIISHDLKSPFNALLTYSESMVENIEKLSEEELREFTIKVSKYSRNVYNLVENLLDWSRIQTGRMEYSPENIGILSVIKEILLVQEAGASKKKITLNNLLVSEIEVFADRNMVSAILNNLVSNGIKFTWPGGAIAVDASRKGGFAEISVSDDGIGMEVGEVSRLFKIDSHFFKTGTSGEKGTGLGLILCKELIEKNGGTISIESRSGKGSRFSFTLPLA